MEGRETELAINPVSKADSKQILEENKDFNQFYEIKKYIGKGATSEIYTVIQKSTGKELAMKIEKKKDNSSMHSKYEYKIYKILQGGPGIPKVYDYFHEENQDMIVMECLGPHLLTLFGRNNNKFSLRTVLMIIEQILYIIEYMHSKDLIHRDIKLENFLIGKGNKNTVIYAIDFGFSKKYRDSKSHLHIPYIDGKTFLGSPNYTSVNTHLGIEQSRRDDIESIGYMMVLLLKGTLPWVGLDKSDFLKYLDNIFKIKRETKLDILCQGLPKEVIAFIQYARNMNFEDKPDYKYLRSLIRKIVKNNEIKLDYNKFDWIVNKLDV